MICQFPLPYPDELIYSLLARYYIRSGYLAYIHAAEDLFQERTIRPNMEFITPLSPAVVDAITKHMSMEDLIQRHTMFPYYGHFLPKERRQKALRALVSMERDYYNLLPLPKRKSDKERYLRYCPLCADQDRLVYGETYWHRTHQIICMVVCPVHGCHLVDTNIATHSKVPPMLKAAEEVIPPICSPKYSSNKLELRVASYMAEVFLFDVDLECDVTIGHFLHYKMENTRYCSIRGQQRKIQLLHEDFMEYYQPLYENWITEQWHLQKMMSGKRTNFYEVCLVAMFLGVEPEELVRRTLPEKSQQQLFDEAIFRLQCQGLKYTEIAERLGASYEVVKTIGEGGYRHYRRPTKTSSGRRIRSQNWEQIDEDTLPLVRDAIKQLQGDDDTRPRKITISTVERILGLPDRRIRSYLPKCKAEIEKCLETKEQYWAREIVWAAKQILRAGNDLTWSRIYHLINLRRINFKAALPYVSKCTDSNLATQISSLLKL